MYTQDRTAIYENGRLFAKIVTTDFELITEIVRRLNGEYPKKTILKLGDYGPIEFFELPESSRGCHGVYYGCSELVLEIPKDIENGTWIKLCEILNTPVQIYTSYFASVKKLPENLCPISISGKAPNGWAGLEYKKLAPKYQTWLKHHHGGTDEDYVKEYNELVLSKLNDIEVVNELLKMADGKIPCLICYETPEKFCHRHVVARWIENTKHYIGVKVGEYKVAE